MLMPCSLLVHSARSSLKKSGVVLEMDDWGDTAEGGRRLSPLLCTDGFSRDKVRYEILNQNICFPTLHPHSTSFPNTLENHAGFYLLLIWLKAHQVFAPVPVEDGAPYASISPGMPADYDGSLLAQGNSAVGIGGRRAGSLSGGVTDAMAKQAGRSVGAMCSARRRLALTETVAHLVFLSAMAVRTSHTVICFSNLI